MLASTEKGLPFTIKGYIIPSGLEPIPASSQHEWALPSKTANDGAAETNQKSEFFRAVELRFAIGKFAPNSSHFR